MKCFKGSERFRTTLVESFLDFSFFLCISPFRVVGKQELKISGWKLHKVVAILIAILDIFGSLTRIRISLDKKLDNPVKYFNFMWSIAATCMHVAFYYVLWTKQEHVLKTVKVFRKSFQNSYKMTKLPCHRTMGIFLCSSSFVMGLLPSFKGSYILPHPTPELTIGWSPLLVFRGHLAHSYFMFFLSNSSTVNSSIIMDGIHDQEMNEVWEFSVWEIILGVGHFVVYTVRYLGAYFIDLFMIVFAVTLWLAANAFVQESMSSGSGLRESKMHRTSNTVDVPITISEGCSRVSVLETDGLTGRNIVEKYSDLKNLADAVNTTMSPILFCYVFEAIFYYATNLNTIFVVTDWHSSLLVAHFLIGCSSVFGFSADVTRKMDNFRLWLVNGSVAKTIGPDRLVALIHETQSKAIGVSAFGIFTIDYPLIFNIVTTTVTFFLIVVQFVPTPCPT